MRRAGILVLGFVAMTAAALPAVGAAPTANNQNIGTLGPGKQTLFSLSYGGSPTAFTIVSNPAHGTLTPYGASYPMYFYYQAANDGYLGPDSFNWKCSNADGSSGTATVSVVIDNAPVANNGSSTMATGARAPVYLSYSDRMGAGTLTFSIVGGPAHGTLEPSGPNSPNGYYTPTPGYVGADSFTWKLNNGFADSPVATYSVTVVANTLPTASSSSRSVSSYVSSSWPLSVTHPSADTYQLMAFTLVSGPSHGTVVLPAPNSTGNKTVSYTSSKDYVGADSFAWKVNDGFGESGVATQTLTVAASAPLPQAQCEIVRKDAATAILAAYSGGSGYTCTVVRAGGPSHGSANASGTTFTYTPGAGYTGFDSFTWYVRYSTPTSAAQNTATVTCSIQVREGVNGRAYDQDVIVMKNTAATTAFSHGWTGPQPLIFSVVRGPAHGSVAVSGANFTYTPAAGYSGEDSFVWRMNDGSGDSNVAVCTIRVRDPRERAGQLVVVVVNNLLLPEISDDVSRLQADLIQDGYTAKIKPWSGSADALWEYLNGEYNTPGQFMAGAMFIGNMPTWGATDLNFWNLKTKGGYTGPYQIWVSRMWGVGSYYGGMSPFGDEVTLLKRALQANHDSRTGVARLPYTAYHYDNAYANSGVAATALEVWPEAVELRAGPSLPRNTPQGMRNAFSRGGDLLSEESHGGGGEYDLYAGDPAINYTHIFHDLAQLRSIICSSCVSGCLGGIVNAQLFTRGGANLLSIGDSQTTGSGSSVMLTSGQAALRACLATGETWGEALRKYPLWGKDYFMAYGDLSIPAMASPSNAVPVLSSFAASTNAGVAPLTVSFTGAASDPDGAVALYEWFLDGYDFGCVDPTVAEGSYAPQSHTYYRAHRYFPRLEVVDGYRARAFNDNAEIRVAPRSDRPLRIACGLAGPGFNSEACVRLDYLSPATGKLWLHDQGYAAGTWGQATWGVGGQTCLNGDVEGSPDNELYARMIGGGATYPVPLSNGNYQVILGFADAWSTGAGQRVVNVSLEGVWGPGWDVYALAGGKTALVVTQDVTVADGVLNIAISNWVNCIEIVPEGYVNHAPAAVADAASTPQGQAVTVDVLANDSDPDTDELFVAAAGAAANGDTVVLSNKRIVYTPRAGFAGADTFTYTLGDGNGGSTVGTVTIAVTASSGNRSPAVAPQATPAQGAEPLPVQFTANGSDADGHPLSFFWDFGDGATSTAATPAHTYTNAGAYAATVTADDGHGGTGIGTVTVYVVTPPVIVSQPADQMALPGKTVTFAVVATGVPPPVYQWKSNGVAIAGATNASWTTPAVTADADGTLYSAVITNSAGSVASRSAEFHLGVRINFQPTSFLLPDGYMMDAGAVYDATRGYGWAVAQGTTRGDRGGADPRLASLVATGAQTGTWNCALLDGDYLLTFVVGDRAYGGVQLVGVQGVLAVSNVSGMVTVTDLPVTVTGGMLSIQAVATMDYLILRKAGGLPRFNAAPNTAGSGSGSIVLSPAGWNYTTGTVVTATAVPDAGSAFTGWSGALTGSVSTGSFTMNSNTAVTATFTKKTCSIFTSAGAGGKVTPAGTTVVNQGAAASIVYTANEWYRIATLTTNGVAVPGAAGSKSWALNYTSVAEPIAATGTFARLSDGENGYANVPTTWLTNWTESAVREGLDALDIPTKYLLGLDPTGPNTYELGVESFMVTGSNAVTVIRRTVTGALAPDGMHGFLKLQGTDRLGAAFTNLSGTAVTGPAAFDGSGRRVYTNQVNGAGQFFRAVIE